MLPVLPILTWNPVSPFLSHSSASGSSGVWPACKNQRSKTTRRTNQRWANNFRPNRRRNAPGATPRRDARDGGRSGPPSPAVRRQPLPAIVAAGGGNRAGRQQARLDRRADAFAALRGGQAGRVADPEHTVGQQRPRRVVVQLVGVAGKLGRPLDAGPAA